METLRRRYRATALAEVMRRQGRRNDWLAMVAGVSEPTVTRLLRGERFTDEATAEKIANAFQLPVSMLFDLSSETENRIAEEAIPA